MRIVAVCGGWARVVRAGSILAFVGCLPLACVHGAENMVRGGVVGGVGGGLEAMNDPENRAMLLRLLRDPEITAAAHDLTAALTGGALDGLTDEQRQIRVRAASDAYIRTIAASVGEALNEDISPAVTRAVNDIVAGAVAGALRPANVRGAQQMVDSVTRSTITAFTQSTATGLRDDLGPALNKVIAEDLGPALQQVIEQNIGPALHKVVSQELEPALAMMMAGENGGATGVFARALTKQIVLGVNDGMSEMGISPSPNAKDSKGGFSWLTIALSVLLLALAILLTRMYFTRRAHARDRKRSEEMLVNILRAIKTPDAAGTDAPASLDTVLAHVRKAMPELDSDNAYLAAIVGKAQLPAAYAAPTKRTRPA